MDSSLQFKLSKAPHKPGCYLWKDCNGIVIYVGKATDLFKRVHQYFMPNRDGKTSLLVQNICDVEYVTVNNENESLLLENNLIKKYKPKYNILLKEGSTYPYIAITKEKDPRIIYTRDLNQKLLHTYGPFAASKYNKFEVYKLVQKLFPLRKCQQLQKKKCLYYDLGQCLGPCIHDIKQSTYDQIIKKIDDFFKGKYKDILKQLEVKEKQLSDNFEFEQAQDVHKLIIGITNIKDNQVINISDKQAIDVVGYALEGKYISIVIFSYAKGKLLAKTQQINELNDTLEQALSSYLVQFYLNNAAKPKKVYLSVNKATNKQLTKVLNIDFITPEKGKFKEILINASINAKEYFKNNYYQYLKQQELNVEAFEKLKQVLNLSNLNIINMFDMSNLFSDAKVGAMIALENGVFNKKLYRKFIIKDLANAGDTQYMKECVTRQYNNAIKNNEALPNLIIADGGWNQVNAIKSALKQINLDQIIPVIGLAKNKNHQTEYIITENKEIIRLDKNSNLYLYLLKIQDEVHRFAISFFRKKKQSSLFRSQLNEIEGIGQKTIDKLLKIYQNIANIKSAGEAELAQYVGLKAAKKIIKSLK